MKFFYLFRTSYHHIKAAGYWPNLYISCGIKQIRLAIRSIDKKLWSSVGLTSRNSYLNITMKWNCLFSTYYKFVFHLLFRLHHFHSRLFRHKAVWRLYICCCWYISIGCWDNHLQRNLKETQINWICLDLKQQQQKKFGVVKT